MPVSIWSVCGVPQAPGRVSYIPSHRESQSFVHITSTELRYGSRKGQPCCHFAQRLHLRTLVSSRHRHTEQRSRQLTMPQTATPVKEYPIRSDRGPACVRARPMPKKRPVPIVPPRAMNWICLDLRFLAVLFWVAVISPCSTSSVVFVSSETSMLFVILSTMMLATIDN